MLRFGAFELDAARFELRHLGRRRPAQRRVLEAIRFLAERRDRVVTREELLAGPWSGAHVTDAALSQVIKQARRLLDDPSGQLIRTVRGKGYRFDAEVTELESTTTPPPRPKNSFFGRARELSRLHRALADAQGGRGSVTLISGDAGIGKTRLIERYADQARAQGVAVLWGRCWEVGAAPALWPWPDLIRSHAEQAKPRELRKLAAGVVDELVAVCPGLKEWLSLERPATISIESHETRFRVLDAVARFIERAAAASPLAIVLEDVHAADEAALLLLDFVSRSIGQSRLHVVATCRELEAEERPLLASALSGLAPNVDRLSLGGLSEEEVAEWLDERYGKEVGVGTAAALQRSTAGHPFLIEAALRDVPAGALAERVHGLELRHVRLPDRIAGTIRARYAALPDTTRDVLLTAAAAGREFQLRLLDAVHESGPIDAVLEPAIAAGLLERADRADAYRFMHVLVRETIYHDAPHSLRTERHLALGRREADWLEDDRDLVFEVARHFVLALPRVDAGVALDFCLRAAEYAQERFVYESAAQHYAQALELLQGNPIDLELRCRLMLQLAHAQYLANSTGEAATTCSQVLELARRERLGAVFAEATLAWFEVLQGQAAVNERFQSSLEEALKLPVAPATRARLLAASAMAFYFRTSSAERQGFISESMDLMRRCADPAVLATIVAVKRSAGVMDDDPDQEFELATEFVREATRSGRPLLLLQALSARGRAALGAGERKHFAADAKQYRELAERISAVEHRWHGQLLASTEAVLAADFHVAEQRAREGLARAPNGRSTWTLSNFGAFLVPLADDATGEHRAALVREIREIGCLVLKDVPAYHAWSVTGAWAALMLDEHDEAQALFERFVDEHGVNVPRDVNYIACLWFFSRMACVKADVPRARVLLRTFPDLLDRHVVVGAAVYLGPVAQQLGELHLTVGDDVSAVAAFRQALREAEAMQAVPWTARARFGLARALALSSPRSPEVSELLEQAGAIARRHTMDRLLEELAAFAPPDLSTRQA